MKIRQGEGVPVDRNLRSTEENGGGYFNSSSLGLILSTRVGGSEA
jgi:hypothetical protein